MEFYTWSISRGVNNRKYLDVDDMNRQKLEHLIETLDFVRRWQVGQTEAVDREIAKAQENYRTMVGHYYHFRENAFYNSPPRVLPSSTFPNEADAKKAEEFHFKCKLCNLEIPSPKEEPTLFDMNQETGEEE